MELYHLNDYCSPDLPLAVWPVQKAGAIGLHRHDCFELVFITRGTGLCRINDLSYPCCEATFTYSIRTTRIVTRWHPAVLFTTFFFDANYCSTNPR